MPASQALSRTFRRPRPDRPALRPHPRGRRRSQTSNRPRGRGSRRERKEQESGLPDISYEKARSIKNVDKLVTLQGVFESEIDNGTKFSEFLQRRAEHYRSHPNPGRSRHSPRAAPDPIPSGHFPPTSPTWRSSPRTISSTGSLRFTRRGDASVSPMCPAIASPSPTSMAP